jgi:hypothetical protein
MEFRLLLGVDTAVLMVVFTIEMIPRSLSDLKLFGLLPMPSYCILRRDGRLLQVHALVKVFDDLVQAIYMLTVMEQRRLLVRHWIVKITAWQQKCS